MAHSMQELTLAALISKRVAEIAVNLGSALSPAEFESQLDNLRRQATVEALAELTSIADVIGSSGFAGDEVRNG